MALTIYKLIICPFLFDGITLFVETKLTFLKEIFLI